MVVGQARATLEHTLNVEIADRKEAVRELRWVRQLLLCLWLRK